MTLQFIYQSLGHYSKRESKKLLVSCSFSKRWNPSGSVLGTNIDLRFLVELATLDHAHIEIQCYDIGADKHQRILWCLSVLELTSDV